jgi:predicted PhzF superfamily epimerase YddE/YHI9
MTLSQPLLPNSPFKYKNNPHSNNPISPIIQLYSKSLTNSPHNVLVIPLSVTTPPKLNITQVMMAPQQTLKFNILDVFTSQPYAGNPLAIIHLPSSLKDSISQEQKQRIAKEFNLSETVFFHESLLPGENQIDIFTTDEELPFAGHPTIGSAAWVLYLSDLEKEGNGKGEGKGVLITKAGRMPISLSLPSSSSTNGGEFRVYAEIPHNTHLHSIPLNFSNLTGFSSNPEIRERELKGTLFSIVKGLTFLFVELDSIDMLGKVEMSGSAPDFDPFLDEGWKPSFVARYYYVLLPQTPENGEVVKIRTRMVEAKMEDPATGSAASALCAFLAQKMGKSKGFEIVQGVEMGRRSEIGVWVEVDGGEIKGIRLSGCAVEVMEGSVRV